MTNKYLRKVKFKRYYKYFYLVSLGFLGGIILMSYTYSKLSVSKDKEVVKTIVGEFISGDVVIGAYINGEYSKKVPKKSDNYIVEKVICDNDTTGEWDYDEWSLITKNITTKSKCNVYFINGYSKSFDYTGSVEEFIVPLDGVYKLEVWGAGGGNGIHNSEVVENDYYAGYSSGDITLSKDDKLYIAVGGKGTDATVGNSSAGGFNGGGAGDWDHNDDESMGGGGGATSIQNALIGDGELKNYENNKDNVLIVAGGSAGGGQTEKEPYYSQYKLSNGGGYIGGAAGTTNWRGTYNAIPSATQDSGYAFGLGASGTDITIYNNQEAPGAGGGWYGGYTLTEDYVTTTKFSFAGGGSGYIGSSLLTNKAMYCFDCFESKDDDTRTIATTCHEETPTEKCSKKGNGYAKITLISLSKKE